MGKKWLKKVLSALTAATLAVGCLSVTAMAAPTEATNVEVADQTYYKSLIGSTAPDKAVITITKREAAVDSTSVTSADRPIKGVKFGIAKIGDLAQINEQGVSTMVYGIQTEIADEIGLTADYVSGDYSYVKDYKAINTALRGADIDTLKTLAGIGEGTATGENGTVRFSDQDYGLYLVLETEIDGAQVKDANGDWGPISIVKKQYPYVVSAPVYNKGSNTWSASVNANAKNETGTASIEKDIVRSYEDTLGAQAQEQLSDTDTTHVGDTVEFKFTSSVPDLTDSADDAEVKMNTYKIQDNLSAGLTLPATFSADNLVITDGMDRTYEINTDYTVSKAQSLYPDGSITEGSAFEILFTQEGLDKLTVLAKSKEEKEISVYYTATVNENAVVGVEGNPNEVRLIYGAGSAADVTTSWDSVKEFIFTMDATKLFDGTVSAEYKDEVSFKLYTDEDCTTGVKVTGNNGNYVYGGVADTEEEISTLTLDDNSLLFIKGVPTDITLYLKELTTADGFNVLKKPVELKLVAAQNGNEYTGVLLSNGTNASVVNGEEANLNDDRTGVTMTINNTSGFQLPTTGGMGVWLFAIAGVLVAAAGFVFYGVTRRKRA